MFKHFLWSAVAALAIALPNYASAGVIVFSTDFTAADGFTDGGLAGQNGFVAQAAFSVTNSAGTGEVVAASPAFQRFTADGNLFDFTTLGVGDQVILDLFDFSASAPSAQIGTLGFTTLTNADGENPGGNGNSQLGGQLTSNGTNYFIDEGSFGVSGGAVDTGIALGTSINYQVEITNQGGGLFDILQTVELAGGGSATTLLTSGVGEFLSNGNFVAPGTANLDDNVAAIFQTQNGAVSNVSIGGFQGEIKAVSTIPEPSSLGLLGLGLAGLLGRRRRR